jgi:hypothetical protein
MMEGSQKRGALWKTHATPLGLNNRLGKRRFSMVCSLCFSWTLLFGLSSAGVAHSEIVPSDDISQPIEMYQVASSNIDIGDSSSSSKLAINPQITTDKLKQAGFILPETASVATIVGSVLPSDTRNTKLSPTKTLSLFKDLLGLPECLI